MIIFAAARREKMLGGTVQLTLIATGKFDAGQLEQDAKAGRLMTGSSPIGAVVFSVNGAGLSDGPSVGLSEKEGLDETDDRSDTLNDDDDLGPALDLAVQLLGPVFSREGHVDQHVTPPILHEDRGLQHLRPDRVGDGALLGAGRLTPGDGGSKTPTLAPPAPQ